MKEHPMLFSGPMVRAILAGRKTQTRRVVKPQPPDGFAGYAPGIIWVGGDQRTVKCPYGRKPGDRLWVRETWADVNTEDGPAICYRANSDYMSWHDFSTTFGPDYGAGPSMDYDAYPGDYTMWWTDLLNGEEGHGWKPSIHMPRWASRITLEITDVRVQRVQDIAPSDARSEGIESAGTIEVQNGHTAALVDDPISKFKALWDSINAKRGYGWDENPWVWVVEFKRLETI